MLSRLRIIDSKMPLGLSTNDLLRVLSQDRAREILQAALELHEQNKDDDDWLGFRWYQVGSSPFSLNRLVADGILKINFRSNRNTHYILTDIEKTREALTLVGQIEPTTAEVEETIPADLFDIIEGLDRVKNVLKLAILSPRPVHSLIVGPPATAKTLLLAELCRLPNSRYALGGTSSRAGLVDFLLREPCRYLVIDEIDKADGRDLSALLSVMETGYISRLKKKMTELERRIIWVFAGANVDTRLPQELKSRFLKIHLQPYTSEEFKRIVVSVLVKRENIDAEMAHYIANQIEPKTKDVRDAVRIARLAQDKKTIDRLIQELF